MTNFRNGALVFRLWKFDGTGEVIGKHQYSSDAEDFAQMKADDDFSKRPKDAEKWMYIVVCEAENTAKAFIPKAPPKPAEAT